MAEMLNEDVWLQILGEVLRERAPVGSHAETNPFRSSPTVSGPPKMSELYGHAPVDAAAERWLSELACIRSDLTGPCQRLLYSREIALSPGTRFERFMRTMTTSAHLAAQTRRLRLDVSPTGESCEAIDDYLARLVAALPGIEHLVLISCFVPRALRVLHKMTSLVSLTVLKPRWPFLIVPSGQSWAVGRGRQGLYLDASALRRLFTLPKLVRLEIDIFIGGMHDKPRHWPAIRSIESRSFTSLTLRLDGWTGKDLYKALSCMPTSVTFLRLHNMASLGDNISLEALLLSKGSQLRHLALSWCTSLDDDGPVVLLDGLEYCTNLLTLKLSGPTKGGHRSLHFLPCSLQSLVVVYNPLSFEFVHQVISPDILLDWFRLNELPQLRRLVYNPDVDQDIYSAGDYFELRDLFLRWQGDMRELASICRKKKVGLDSYMEDEIEIGLERVNKLIDDVGDQNEADLDLTDDTAGNSNGGTHDENDDDDEVDDRPL